MDGHEHEVVVLGGGPAGAAAATLLALRSHEVALVRPALTPAGALAESVPPSAKKLLRELGLLQHVERARFHANRGNKVWWAGGAGRHEPFAEGDEGYHVERRAFEDALVGAAESNGVQVYEGFSARSSRESEGGWGVTCSGPGGPDIELRAPWILDATGRRGFLARREGREPDPSTTTLALLGRWRKRGGWAAETAHHTLVESYVDGWAWSVPLSSEVRCFSAVIDQRGGALEGRDPAETLAAELAKTEHIGALLDSAEPHGGAWACPASLYASRRYARAGLLLLGDAASFIDPLSSFGVKKALSSGWLAAVVAHTALTEPALAGTAVDFYDGRERDVYRSYRRLSARFFEEAAEEYGHAYWRVRAQAAREAGGWHDAGDAEADPDALGPPDVPQDRVEAAFDVIRSRERLGAVQAPSLRRFDAPAVEGHRIVLAEHVGSDACPGGMRFAHGVHLPRLVAEAPKHEQVPDLWAAYNGVATPVSLPVFLTGLATAFAAGLLDHAD